MARRIVAGDRSKPKRVPAKSKPTGLRGGKPYEPDKGGQGTPKQGHNTPKPKQGSATGKPPKVGDNRPKQGTEAYRKMVKAKNKAAGRRSY
jgi:hypothetical protein